MAINANHPNKSGQALIEFCIGLVAMLAVIGGIFQLGRMGMARTDARVDATRFATARSMLDSDVTGLSVPNYIIRMSEGDDEATYSVDDSRIGGDEGEVYDRFIDSSRPERLRAYAPGNEMAEMSDSFEMLLGMGLVQGVGTRYNIPVFPIVRRLFFDQPTVDIRVSAWMVRTGELY